MPLICFPDETTRYFFKKRIFVKKPEYDDELCRKNIGLARCF